MKYQNILKESFFLLLYAILIIAIILPRSIFNMDMEDEGWVLTAYQNIFSTPSSVSYNFLYYNSILLGGIWNLLFGQYGLLSFRFFHILIEVVKAVVVYLLLKRYLNKYAIAFGFIVYEWIFQAYMFAEHSQLTSLLCLLAILFIAKALENKKCIYMLFGGIFVGINVFSRLPNITFSAFIFVLFPFWYITKNHKLTVYMLMTALIGFFLGCIFEFIVMFSLGHFDIFVENISCGLSASSDADSTHNIVSMSKMYFVQLRKIWYQISIIGFLLFIFIFIKKLIRDKSNNIYYITSFFLLAFSFIMAYHQHNSLIGERLYSILTIICSVIIVIAPSMLKYLAILAIILLYVFPLGTDWGYDCNIIYHAMCLALPLSIAYVINEVLYKRKNLPIVFAPIVIFILVIVCTSAYTTGIDYAKKCVFVYTDEHKIKIHSPLATTFFSEGTFIRLNPLLDELSLYVKEGDELLCYQSPAMVHYLTRTIPYLENAWPWTYTSSSMEYHFIKAQSVSRKLPVIVREKGWVCDIFNVNNYPDWDNSSAKENRYHKNKKIKLIQDFIVNNNYHVVWEDNAFQILLPPGFDMD